MIERYKHNQMNTSISSSACFRSFHLIPTCEILVISPGALRGKKKTKTKNKIWHRERAGQTFWRTIWPQKHLWSMRSRVSKGVPLSLIFYIEWMSLTFICFDCWCKMWGFAPNSFRGQKWNTGARNGQHRANQKWSTSRTRNGHKKTVSTILQLRARPISSSERKHMILHSSRKNNYILLYVALLPLCERTAYPRRERTRSKPYP